MAEIKDKTVTVESLAVLHEHNKNTYMPMIDPTGSGTLSINNIKIDSIEIGNVLIEPTTDALNFIFLDEEAVTVEES